MSPSPFPDLPVIELPGGRIQVGVDPRRRVRLDGDLARRLREALTAGRAPDPPLAALLARAGLPTTAPAPAALPGVLLFGAGVVRDRIRDSLIRAGATVLTPRGIPDALDPDAVVAVLVGPVPWTRIEPLMTAGVAHLVVSPRRDSVRLGPFVHPGRTPCTRCLHLARCDRDPDWRWVSLRLARQPQPVPPIDLADRAAAGVTHLVRAETLRRRKGEDRIDAGYWEMSDHDLAVTHRPLAAHPGCGCWWPLAV